MHQVVGKPSCHMMGHISVDRIFFTRAHFSFIYVADKEFSRQHNLKGHMALHRGGKQYVCFCGASFTLKGTVPIYIHSNAVGKLP